MTLTWALLGTNAVAARVSAPMSGSTPTVTAAGGTITTRGAVASTIPIAVPPWMNAMLAGWLLSIVMMDGSTPAVTAAGGIKASRVYVATTMAIAVPPLIFAKLARPSIAKVVHSVSFPTALTLSGSTPTATAAGGMTTSRVNAAGTTLISAQLGTSAAHVAAVSFRNA